MSVQDIGEPATQVAIPAGMETQKLARRENALSCNLVTFILIV